jgi:O-methyltransferase involved in polyketide biosynthesis
VIAYPDDTMTAARERVAQPGSGIDGSQLQGPQALRLSGVPETMLWTLHARASEHAAPKPLLRDARAAALVKLIDCDFTATFGEPNRLFAVRAALLDGAIRRWARAHPDGLVVSLGEGLETQAWRVDNGSLRWLSIDLPESIGARERFFNPGGRFTHLAADVTAPGWMSCVDATRGVFFVAQGLFMYLQPGQVERIFRALATRFPGAELAFDIVPRWLSDATCRTRAPAPGYTLPPMPWGLDRHEIAPTLRRWHPGLRKLRFLPYRVPGRAPARLAEWRDIICQRNARPSLVQATL